MKTPNEISIRRLLSPEESRTADELRRMVLHQVIYFLMESGQPKSSVAKDVQAILGLPEGVAPPTGSPMMPKETLAYGEILTEWGRDPEYLDARGMPRVLAIRSSDQDARTFERLCRETYPHLEPDEVLAYLTLYRAVVDRGGEVEMTESYLRLNKKDQESALYSVMVLAGLLNTMTLNRRDDAALFQRGTWVPNVDPDAVESLRHLVHKSGMAKIEFFDKWMLQHQAPAGTQGVPVMIGLYMSAGVLNDDGGREQGADGGAKARAGDPQGRRQ